MMRYWRVWWVMLIVLGAGVQVAAARTDECVATATCGLADETILAYPAPNVRQLPTDEEALYDRVYRQVVRDQTLNIYGAPGGAITETRAGGYNFVTLSQDTGDWAEINPGQWVQTSQLTTEVYNSTFSGILLPEDGEDLPYTVAWSLVNQHAARVPGGSPVDSNPMLWRYTLLNIYAAVVVNDEQWYQVGVDQWVHQYNVARVLPVARPDGVDTHKWVSVDLYEQVVVAYEGDAPVYATLISSGLARWETNEGLFNIYWRKDRDNMSGGQPGDDFYYLEEVPWAMFFDEGIALHGTYWHNNFGYRQSHGCVNMSITDAHWLWQWSADEFDWTVEGDVGAAVYVHSSGEYAS